MSDVNFILDENGLFVLIGEIMYDLKKKIFC